MSLNAGDVLISSGSVEERDRISERFEFRVGKNGSDMETAMFI